MLGDVIVGFNQTEVKNLDDLSHLLEDAGVGAEVVLTLERDGRQRQVELTLIAVE